jgi:hypothetical protein
MHMRFVVAAAAAFGFGAPAQAGLVTYGDFGSWSGAVSGIATTIIPDPAPLGFILIGVGDASVTYGDIAFSQSSLLSNGSLYNVGPLSSLFPAVLSSQQQTTGTPNVLISLPSAVDALALNYGNFLGSPVTFTFSNGDSVTLGTTVSSEYAVPDFFGVTDTAAFTSVLLTETDTVDALNLNNVNVASARVIPEPATWTMMAIGFAGLAAAGLRFSGRRTPA